MCPKHTQPNKLAAIPAQRGSMLVIALFVIIVLGLLGLTMTRLLSSSSEAIIYEVLGQRALNAARAGIECAVADRLDELDDGEVDEQDTSCTNPVSKTFSGVAGLESCEYSVVEGTKTITDGGRTFNYMTFMSTGQCRVGNINVTRSLYIDAMETL